MSDHHRVVIGFRNQPVKDRAHAIDQALPDYFAKLKRIGNRSASSKSMVVLRCSSRHKSQAASFSHIGEHGVREKANGVPLAGKNTAEPKKRMHVAGCTVRDNENIQDPSSGASPNILLRCRPRLIYVFFPL
jgi:hypothetical protein